MRWKVASSVSVDRLATSETADCMHQNIEFPKTRHNLISQLSGARYGWKSLRLEP